MKRRTLTSRYQFALTLRGPSGAHLTLGVSYGLGDLRVHAAHKTPGLRNSAPKQYTGPVLCGSSGEVAMEELELATERIEIVPPTGFGAGRTLVREVQTSWPSPAPDGSCCIGVADLFAATPCDWGAELARERIEPDAHRLSNSLPSRRRPGCAGNLGRPRTGNTIRRVGVRHQELELDRLVSFGKPLCARTPQFDRVWKTRSGDTHAVATLCKH
jgi:hypothetical protein